MSDRLRAWAVVCSDDMVHSDPYEAPDLFTKTENRPDPWKEARVRMEMLDDLRISCGPHRVAELAEVEH